MVRWVLESFWVLVPLVGLVVLMAWGVREGM